MKKIKSMVKEKSVRQFDQDVRDNKGYVYANTEKLSNRYANQCLQNSIRELIDLKGKRVVDLGSGDGTFTLEFLQDEPAYLLGLDASRAAVHLANQKAGRNKKVRFKVLDIYKVGSLRKKFDVAILRGVLHHLYDPERAISAMTKIAQTIIVVEPNGYNPVLKILEKFSKYHIEHEEKSFFPPVLDQWFEKHGGKVEKSGYRGLVPFFCPDWMAILLKTIEPLVERLPLLRELTCAVYVFKVSVK